MTDRSRGGLPRARPARSGDPDSATGNCPEPEQVPVAAR